MFYSRYAISQYLDYAGDVIAHLNITSIRVEDGGLYTCMASNALGIVEHSARINVYGKFWIIRNYFVWFDVPYAEGP